MWLNFLVTKYSFIMLHCGYTNRETTHVECAAQFKINILAVLFRLCELTRRHYIKFDIAFNKAALPLVVYIMILVRMCPPKNC